jgi:hypothetical protein
MSDSNHLQAALRAKLEELQQLEGMPLILYCCGGITINSSKPIQDEDVPTLYECIRRMPPSEQLGVVLFARGGQIHAARRAALILREHRRQVHLYIPYKARSAATLLCLAANELVMTSIAELGPIDAIIAADSDYEKPLPQGSPSLISSDEIKTFREMAENWFGLDKSHNVQIFGLMAQRIFPATLSRFYRAEQQIRMLANELLTLHLPDKRSDGIAKIIGELLGGRYDHNHSITRQEALELGLPVRYANFSEEAILWEIITACDTYMKAKSSIDVPQQGFRRKIDAVICTDAFFAEYTTPIPDSIFSTQLEAQSRQKPPIGLSLSSSWIVH